MGKRYDKEFKITAVRQASEPGNIQSSIERDLGLDRGVISRWKIELQRDGECRSTLYSTPRFREASAMLYPFSVIRRTASTLNSRE